MKLHRFALFAALLSSTAFAQTNTYPFPSSGSVGIGTTTPQWNFEVVGPTMGIRSDNGNATNLTIKNTRPGGHEWALVSWGDQSGGGAALTGKFSLYDNTSGGHRLVVGTDGNVGIGTFGPASKLEVAGGGMSVLGFSNDNSGPNGGLEIGFDGAQGVIQAYDRQHSAGKPLWLNYGIGNTILGSNVGIGTINPAAKLVISDGGNLGFEFAPSNSTNTALMEAYDRSSGTYKNLRILSANTFLNDQGGNVGIGTTNPTHKLAVNGTIKAKEIIVETTGWSDYVLAKNYKLQSLSEVEAHINDNGHLPGIPSAAQVAEQGVSVGEMQARLLAKVEELTLHIIAQEKKMAAMQAQIQQLQSR